MSDSEMLDKKHNSTSSEESSSSSDHCYSPDEMHHPGYQHLTKHTRIKRLRANDRERRRVHLINCAMESLREVIPGLQDKKKLTKLDLLRAANQYIWLLDEAVRTGKSIDELLTTPNEPTIYYVNYTPMPVLKREPYSD